MIGHAPRHLDRNIALVGRVIEGMEHLSSLPRGSGRAGVIHREEAGKRTPILTVRVASDLPAAEQPAFENLSTESATFRRLCRSHRQPPRSLLHHPRRRRRYLATSACRYGGWQKAAKLPLRNPCLSRTFTPSAPISQRGGHGMKIGDRKEFHSKAPPLTCPPETTVYDAVTQMAEKNFGSVVRHRCRQLHPRGGVTDARHLSAASSAKRAIPGPRRSAR